MIAKRAKLFFNLFLLLLSHQVHTDDVIGYAINSESATIHPINFTSNTMSSPISVGTFPYRILITPDKTTAYVTDLVSTNPAVYAIRLATRAVTKIPLDALSGNYPTTIAISANGKTVAVLADLGNILYPIDVATNTLKAPISLGGSFSGRGLCLNSSGTTAYVCSGRWNGIVPVDMATGTVGSLIETGLTPIEIQISTDDRTAYVANYGGDTITSVDLTTNTAQSQFVVGQNPSSIAITPDGTKLYAVSYANNTVSAIDLSTGTVGSPISFQSQIFRIVILADGKTAYLSGYGVRYISILDLETSTISTFLSPNAVDDLACIISPLAPIAAFTAIPASVNAATRYDASSSSFPVNTTPSYFWDFGDGVTQITTTDKTTHTYTRSGTFKVILTVSYTPTTAVTDYPTDTVHQNIQVCPSTPSSFTVKRTNKHHKLCTNKLTWNKSADPSVIGYKIVSSDGSTKWRSALLPTYFKDRKCIVKKSYRYSLEAYNGSGTCSSRCWTTLKQ